MVKDWNESMRKLNAWSINFYKKELKYCDNLDRTSADKIFAKQLSSQLMASTILTLIFL